MSAAAMAERTVPGKLSAGTAPRGRAALRVLVVEDDTLVGLSHKKQLEKLGHEVVGQAASAGEAIELFDSTNPDVVLMDIKLDGTDGLDLATRLLATRRVPMVVVSAYSDAELILRAGEAGVYGYLVKPVTTEAMAAQIEVARRRFADAEQLRAEKDQLAATLETRKLVERAKGIFMKRLKLDEPEAHKRLQQESQKRRISLAELCKKIIESEEIMGS